MRLKFFYFFLLASFILNSQQRKLIKGKLLYRNNNVIAANVINNTEQYNTITDSEGEFEVNVKKGDEIIFSTKKEKNTVQIKYLHFAKDVKIKEKVILDDGKILL